jgi:hypothetical protein
VANILYRKILRFLLFLFKPGKKNMNKDFNEVQAKPREYQLSQVNTSLAK